MKISFGIRKKMRWLLPPVAEGVETLEQQTQLAALNCDLLQGYLFSKPIPATDFALRLQSSQSLTD